MNLSDTKVLYKYFTSPKIAHHSLLTSETPMSALKESLADYHTVFFEAEYSGECSTPKVLLLLSSWCQEQNINGTISSTPHPPSLLPSSHGVLSTVYFLFFHRKFSLSGSPKAFREIANFSNMAAP